MKVAKKLRPLIFGRDKEVHALSAMKCLSDTDAMDLSINELYYEKDDTKEQMNFNHIQQDIPDMWWNFKLFYYTNNIYGL